MAQRLSSDFNKFWFSRSVSVFGSQISVVALPLLAVLTLEATPTQMGWLTALQQLPMAFFGLMAGVWVDRARRRPMLVVTNFAQGALVAAIPLAAYGGWLTLPLVYAVAFVANSFRVVEGVAERAFLPSIVPKDRLLEGNSKIWFSYSLSQAIGPGIAGALVTAIGAPFALALDAVSYLVSGASLASIRGREARAAPAERRAWTDVRLGLEYLARDPVLRPLVLCGGMHNVFSVMLMTLYFIYLARELALAPYVLGVVLAAGGIGAIAGSVVALRFVGRWGSPRTLIAAQLLTGAARLLVPLAFGPSLAVAAWLAVSEFLLGASRSVFNITQISLRQTIIPAESMGRVNASIAFVLWAFTPIGALAAAAVAEWAGLRGTLWVAAVGVLLATGWLLPRNFAVAGSAADGALRA